MLRELDLQNLIDIDNGRVGIVMQRHIDEIVRDMDDRPGDKKPRQMNVKLTFVPVINEGGELEDVHVRFELPAPALPKRQTKWITMSPRRKTVGGKQVMSLVFNDLAEDDPSQRTLDEQEGGGGFGNE